jgi:hypothetical protein
MPSANTLLNPINAPGLIAKESLRILRNSMVAGGLVHREYKNEFVNAKTGGTVTIRKPVKFVASSGATRANQNITEQTTSISVDQRRHVSWAFNSEDLTDTIEKYSERYLQPAMNTLADQVDLSLLALGQKFYNAVGTPGTVPATFAVLGDAATKLDNEACPQDDRSTILNPNANWSMSNALANFGFNQSMNNDVIRKGKLGRLANSDVYMGQNVARATLGARGGTPLANAASPQTGASLITDGWTNSTTVVAVGDVFTIGTVSANQVFAVNPVNYASTGQLRQFVVATGSSVTSSAGGALTLTISPAVTITGAYQNCSQGIVDNAPLTFLGTASTAYSANLMFHRDALGLVTVPLAMPDGVAFKARATHEGVSVRVIKDYDIDNDEDIIRLDIFYGVKELYPELGVRVMG